MRKWWRKALATGLAGLFVTATGGCSTVILSDANTQARATAIEHEALKAAAKAVSQTPWTRPDEASLTERLTVGIAGGARFSEADAARQYLESLSAPKISGLFADAGRQLGAAETLIEAADAATTAIRPAMSDVVVVETAISDLRQSRDIYLVALKELARGDAKIDPSEIKALKASFGAAIERLGAAADELAERVDDDETRTFAGPAAKFLN